MGGVKLCVGRAESETETHTRRGAIALLKFLMPDKWVTMQEKKNKTRQDTENPVLSGKNLYKNLYFGYKDKRL